MKHTPSVARSWRAGALCSALTALLLAPLAALHAADAPSQRPNIIFLLSDDQTIGAVGCYGNKDVITPHLDKLAGEGVRFLNHYNTSSICMASRASIMTGLYEYRHGCNFSHGDLERRLVSAGCGPHGDDQRCRCASL